MAHTLTLRAARILGPVALRVAQIRHHWAVAGVGIFPVAAAAWLADPAQWPFLATSVATATGAAAWWGATLARAWPEATRQLRAEAKAEADLALVRFERSQRAAERAEAQAWDAAFAPRRRLLRSLAARLPARADRRDRDDVATERRLVAEIQRQRVSVRRTGSRTAAVAVAVVAAALPLAIASAPIIPAAVSAVVTAAEAVEPPPAPAEPPVAEPDEAVEDREAPEAMADVLSGVVVMLVPLAAMAVLAMTVSGLGRRW